MTRDKIKEELFRIFRDEFEIENPGLDDDLREVYDFDSIDAIELLREIEILLDIKLSQDEKKLAMEIRTLNDIMNYMEKMAALRSLEN